MSCHSIGRGMNFVSNKVFELYNCGIISKEAEIQLVHACRKGVHWCDGNEYEAFDGLIEEGICGLCFEKCDEVTEVYDNDIGYPDRYSVFDDYDDTAAHYFLCDKCKAKVIDAYRKKETIND